MINLHMETHKRDQHIVERIKEILAAEEPYLELGYEGLGDDGLVVQDRRYD